MRAFLPTRFGTPGTATLAPEGRRMPMWQGAARRPAALSLNRAGPLG